MTVVYSTEQIDEQARLTGEFIGNKFNESMTTFINHRTGQPMRLWVGTQAEYDNTSPKDSNVAYIINDIT